MLETKSNLKDNFKYNYKVLKKLEEIREYAKQNVVPIIRPKTQKHLVRTVEDLLEKRKKIRILEIGTAVGYSSITLAHLSDNIIIDTIEKDEKNFEIAKENIHYLELDSRINMYNEDAITCIEKEEITRNNYDLIFIDANKSKYLEYFQKTENLIDKEKGGYIFTDNVLFMGYVLGEYTGRKHRTIVMNLRKYLDEVLYSGRYDTKLYEVEDGYTVTKFSNIKIK